MSLLFLPLLLLLLLLSSPRHCRGMLLPLPLLVPSVAAASSMKPPALPGHAAAVAVAFYLYPPAMPGALTKTAACYSGPRKRTIVGMSRPPGGTHKLVCGCSLTAERGTHAPTLTNYLCRFGASRVGAFFSHEKSYCGFQPSRSMVYCTS